MANRQMEKQSLLYAAYMVRIWRDSPQSPWRASAQSVADGEVFNFGNLPALFEFLALRSDEPLSSSRRL